MASDIDPRLRLEKLAEKQMKSGMHVRFLEDCNSADVVPKGLSLKLKVNVGTNSSELQTSIDKLLHKVSMEICDRIKEYHIRNSMLLKTEIENVRSDIAKTLTDSQMNELDSTIQKSISSKQSKLLIQHQKKLEHLQQLTPTSHSTLETVKTIESNKTLDGKSDDLFIDLTGVDGFEKVVSKRQKRNFKKKINKPSKYDNTKTTAPQGQPGKRNSNSVQKRPPSTLPSDDRANTTTSHKNKTVFDKHDRYHSKNEEALGTAKTYAEAVQHRATHEQLVQKIESLEKTVQQLVAMSTTTTRGKQEDSLERKTGTNGRKLRRDFAKCNGVKRRY